MTIHRFGMPWKQANNRRWPQKSRPFPGGGLEAGVPYSAIR
jgi:hypothetical protein